MGRLQIRYVGLNIDSNVDLFTYLVEGNRFGSWKDLCLNCA